MNETRLIVEGMTCPSCIRHVGGALEEVDGVNAVDVFLREGKVLVRHQGGVPTEDLVRAVASAGYEARTND